MKMTYNDASQAYLHELRNVMDNYEYKSAPRGQETRELLHAQFSIKNPTSKSIITKDEERNKVIASYLEKEFKWYMLCNRKADSAPSKFWLKIADKDGNINSNYGHLVFEDKSEGGGITPWSWAKESLLKDNDTRQAILRFNKPKHCVEGNKDFVCTMYANFHIRDNRLHMVTRMRSADLFTGPVYDIPFFIKLQEMMLNELQTEGLELEMGEFTFSADSLHIYERNFEAVHKMLGRPIIHCGEPSLPNAKNGTCSFPTALYKELKNSRDLNIMINVTCPIDKKVYSMDLRKAVSYMDCSKSNYFVVLNYKRAVELEYDFTF